MVRKPATARCVLSVALGCVLLLVAAIASAQNDVTSPADRFAKGLKFLKDHGMTLIVEYAPREGAEPTRKTIAEYYEMVMLANKKVATTVLVAKESGEEVEVAKIPGREMPSKGLGAWLWYKMCAAIGQLDACREAGIVSTASD